MATTAHSSSLSEFGRTIRIHNSDIPSNDEGDDDDDDDDDDDAAMTSNDAQQRMAQSLQSFIIVN